MCKLKVVKNGFQCISSKKNQETADFVTFTEEIVHANIIFCALYQLAE